MHRELLKQVHELSLPDKNRTLHMMKEKYTWSNIGKDVKHCEKCQKAKVWMHTKAPIHQIPTTGRFHTVHIDLVGPLPPSNGFQYLMTMIDRFIRCAEVVPVKDMSTESVVQAFLQEWYEDSGYQEPYYRIEARSLNQQFGILMQQVGIDRKRTTAYHPACNGAIEKLHRTLKNALRTKRQSQTWHAALPLCMLGIRATMNESGYSLAQLVYGSSLELPVQFFVPKGPEVDRQTENFLRKFYGSVQTSRNRRASIPKSISFRKIQQRRRMCGFRKLPQSRH